MSFATAGEQLIDRLSHGLYDAGKTVMRESLVLCPISDETTYIELWGTDWRTIHGKRTHFDDDEPHIVGDEGTLRRSGRVFPPTKESDRITVTIGYGFGEELNPAGHLAAEYAVPVHEKSELHHTPPEQSHYLLDPVVAFGSEMGAYLAGKAKESPSGDLTVVEGRDLQSEAA